MDSMVLVTDWNFRSNEDSRAPADEADEEEALLLPPPPPAAIFPVCTSAAGSLAAAAAAAAGAGKNNHCECVKAAGGEEGQGVGMLHALGSSGGRQASCWARWRLPHAARRGCGLRRFVGMVRGWCLNQKSERTT